MAILDEVAWHLQICTFFYQVRELTVAHGPLVLMYRTSKVRSQVIMSEYLGQIHN